MNIVDMTEYLNFTQKEHLRHLTTLKEHDATSEAVYASGIGLLTDTCNQLKTLGALELTRVGKKHCYKITTEGVRYLEELETAKINDFAYLAISTGTCKRSLLSENSGALYPAFVHIMTASSAELTPGESADVKVKREYLEADAVPTDTPVKTWRSPGHMATLVNVLESALKLDDLAQTQSLDMSADSKEAVKYKGAKMTEFDLANISLIESYFTRKTGKQPPSAFIYSASLLTLALLIQSND